MAYLNRKVTFHQLKVLRNDNDQKIPMDKVFELFEKITSQYKSYKEEGYNILSDVLVPGEDNQITIDIIKYDKNIAFCRIGRTKDIQYIHKRNLKNLSTNKIDVTDEEAIEIFSFFLLDFKYGIITHMFGRSAPKIKVFEYLFKDSIIKDVKNVRLRAEIDPIPNDDAIKMLSGINRFYSLEARFSIPASKFFEKFGIKMGQNEYLKLANLESKNISLIIAGGDEDIRKDQYRDLQDSIMELYELKDSEVKKLTIKANLAHKDKAETVNLLQEYFTREVYLQQEPRKTYIPIESIENQLKYVFDDMFEDLISRIK